MAFNYKQGYFIPEHKHKYVGDVTKIFFRSSWERRVMSWCDRTPYVIQWSSEETIIPYISPIDNKMHRYFLDFKVKIRNKEGIDITYLIEVKPEAQTIKPKQNNKKPSKFLAEATTWMVNEAKWLAAEKYAKTKGYRFIILTEKDIL